VDQQTQTALDQLQNHIRALEAQVQRLYAAFEMVGYHVPRSDATHVRRDRLR
jgi:hypothetical protein